jgi:hypothetical protein
MRLTRIIFEYKLRYGLDHNLYVNEANLIRPKRGS